LLRFNDKCSLLDMSVIVHVRVFTLGGGVGSKDALVRLVPLVFAQVVAVDDLLVVGSTELECFLPSCITFRLWLSGQMLEVLSLRRLFMLHTQAEDLSLSR